MAHMQKQAGFTQYPVRQLLYMKSLLYLSRPSVRPQNFSIVRYFARQRHRNAQKPVGFSGHLSELIVDPEQVGNEENVSIRNTQRKVPIDVPAMRNQLKVIMKILNIHNFKVSVWITSEAQIRTSNARMRNKSESTDILSIRANKFSAPEIVKNMDSDKYMGEMIIAPAYVLRQCLVDKRDHDAEIYEDDGDAGVSKVMATQFTVEERMPLLLIHSVLHMVGYDHETEEDWAVMTRREEEVMKVYNEQYGRESPVSQKAGEDK